MFFGLGTFYIIATNGLMLGGIFAFTHQHGMAGELLKFVVAHGVVELSVICLAGAAGMMLGESLIRPTHATRRESFRVRREQDQQAAPAVRAAAGRVRLHRRLHFAGPDFPMMNRVIIGFGFWSRDARRAERTAVRP